jgi:proton-dependent oligopeptide transporter, POT family
LIPPTAGADTAAGPIIYPSFLGFEITNLYEFFMLFIIMTGVAATILFVLSSWLQKMMHNDHVEGVDL